MNVFHVLQQGKHRVVLCGRCDDARHCQHLALLDSGAEIHLPHEVLDAEPVQNAIRIDEEDEHVVIVFQVPFIDPVDELERHLLAVAFASMWKTRNRNARMAVSDV
jgi:hypothetical protein